MTSPVMPPFARVHQVPEVAYGLLAGLAVLGADAGVIAVWWWGEQGVSSPARTWLVGLLTATLVAVVLVLMVRHQIARRATVGTLAVAMVLDAIVIGYEMSGLR
jgi:hypothetical protein